MGSASTDKPAQITRETEEIIGTMLVGVCAGLGGPVYNVRP